MVIKNNLTAANSNRFGGIIKGKIVNNTEKLSSGYKINRAADNAAGLAISEKMRRQIRGLTQATANTQDGVSFCQIADGALDEVQVMVKRCKELALQAANGTETDEDRSYIQMEIDAITGEIDRVHETAEFNEIKVFSDHGIKPGMYVAHDFEINISLGFVDDAGTKVSSVSKTESAVPANANANSTMADFSVKAAEDAVTELKKLYPSLFSSGSTSGINVGLNLANIDGKGNTLATASLQLMSSASSVATAYTLNVDTSDYSVAGFDSMNDAQKAELAATIAHEMTHLVMFDTLTKNMLGSGSEAFPTWMVEGSAQASSGDNGWLSYYLSPTSSDADVKNYMSQIKSMPYGAGYLATMTLGAVAGGGGATSSNIAKGLDKIFSKIADKSKTIDEAINDATGGKYTGLSDFENKFRNAEASTFSVAKDIINARGTTGAGSLFGALGDSDTTVFSESKLTGKTGDYAVDKTSAKVINYLGVPFDLPKEMYTITGGSGISLQVGSEKDNNIFINQYDISAKALFTDPKIDVSTADAAINSLELIDLADARVSEVRSYYGAMQNRLEHTIKNLQNVVENTTAAESIIRDTDMAAEMVDFSKNNIIMQAAHSMLAQANQSNQGVLSLLN